LIQNILKTVRDTRSGALTRRTHGLSTGTVAFDLGWP